MKNNIETININLQINNNNPKNFPNKLYINELLKAKYIKNDKTIILNHNFNIQKNFNMWIDTSKESESSLIGGYLVAYLNNYSITINPDVIWLIIIQGFSRYIYMNKEIINKKNNNDRKLKKITIKKEYFFPSKSTENNWKDIIQTISNKINSFLGDNTLHKLLPNFSSTDSMSVIACNLLLLHEKNKLIDFENKENLKGCFPNIILEGSVEDWVKIKNKIKYLDNFELSWWTKELIIIIDNFIKIKIEKSNNYVPYINFLKNMIINEENGNNGSNISIGWIFKFFPDFENKTLYKSFNEIKIPSSNIRIPFNLSTYNFLKKIDYECSFEMGIFWEIINKNIYQIKPRLNYIIICNNKINKKNYIKIINNIRAMNEISKRKGKLITSNSTDDLTKESPQNRTPYTNSVASIKTRNKLNKSQNIKNKGKLYSMKVKIIANKCLRNSERKPSFNPDNIFNKTEKKKNNNLCLLKNICPSKSNDINNKFNINNGKKPGIINNEKNILINRMNLYKRQLTKDEHFYINKTNANISQINYMEKMNNRIKQDIYRNPMLKDI